MVSRDLRPELPKSLYEKIEEDVVQLHIELELSIPVKPSDVAARLGYIVKRLSDYEIGDELLSLIRIGSDGKPRDGLSFYDSEVETYIIWINDIDTFDFKHDEFTIMHEIGHIRMGHKEDSQLAEMIANYYAAYALVPSPLPFMYDAISSYIDIAETFGVSGPCAYNCERRCLNWHMYSGRRKDYEEKLITYYKGVLERGKSL